MSTRIAVATAIGCFAALPLLGLGPAYVSRAAGVQKPPQGPPPFATLINLPALNGGPAQTEGINDAGTVIVGRSWGRPDALWAVTWTLQNGKWAISKLPAPVPQPYAVARGIDTFGNVVGYSAMPPQHPSSGPLQADRLCSAAPARSERRHAISANGQIIVGQVGNVGLVGNQAAVWSPSGSCTELLPPLEAGGIAQAWAVTGDGSIIGGIAKPVSQPFSVPVRWVLINGQWQIQQLDTRPGRVNGANASGDLVGKVEIACPAVDGCRRAVIWSASDVVTELETLGGEFSSANDINAEGEVVGSSTTSDGVTTPYFWSASTGMLPLPTGRGRNRGGQAFALSDVRPDGTRLVVGQQRGGRGLDRSDSLSGRGTTYKGKTR